MSNILKVEIKNTYGNKLIYPVCNTSKIFAQITNTKTLTSEVIEKIKLLGYKFEQVKELI